MIQREHIIYSVLSKEENFRVTQKKYTIKSGKINDIKGFTSFRVRRKTFEYYLIRTTS